MINQAVLIGNLGRDPEVKYSTNGMAIASFSICFKSSKDKTGWIDVVCFGKLAENVSTALHKGAKIGVSGMLDQNSWTDNAGNNRSKIQIIANIIEYIKTDGRGLNNNQQQNNNNQQQNNGNSNYNNNFQGGFPF